MREIKLEDIDGTVLGRAALVTINLNDPWSDGKLPSLTRTDFSELDGGVHGPMQACRTFWESVKTDWPDHQMAVVGNDRAKYLDWVDLMTALDNSPEGLTPEAYLQTKKP